MVKETYFDLIEGKQKFFNNENAAIRIITDSRIISDWEEKRKKELSSFGKPTVWGEIGVVFTDPYFIILRDLVEFPGGQIGAYSRLINQADIQGGQGVVVFPVLEGKVLLLRNYRHATRSWEYEIPRGFGEPGTEAIDQAHHEIKEEISGEIEKLISLGDYYNNTGIEGNRIRLFLAHLKSVGKPLQEAGIESYKEVTVNELEKMIADETITDGFTIAAYTRAKLRGLI